MQRIKSLIIRRNTGDGDAIASVGFINSSTDRLGAAVRFRPAPFHIIFNQRSAVEHKLRPDGQGRIIRQASPQTDRINPPSTFRLCPVIYPAPSDTRNAIVAATSALVP